MCGRYTISHSTEEILERFQALAEKISVQPSYNVAPSQTVPVIAGGEEEGHEGNRLLQLCKWGLLPFWVKDPKGARAIINARAEGLTTKPAFKKAFLHRRCLIPADGFYEWKKDGTAKLPVRIHLAGDKLFGFAGIYQDNKAPDGTKIRTVAIITVTANDVVKDIHDRMPAILTAEWEGVWLDPTVADEVALQRCLAPYPLDDLETYVVSNLVNKAGTNGPELIEPAKPEKAGSADSEPKVAETSDKLSEPGIKRARSGVKRSKPDEKSDEKQSDSVQLKLPF